MRGYEHETGAYHDVAEDVFDHKSLAMVVVRRPGIAGKIHMEWRKQTWPSRESTHERACRRNIMITSALPGWRHMELIQTRKAKRTKYGTSLSAAAGQSVTSHWCPFEMRHTHDLKSWLQVSHRTDVTRRSPCSYCSHFADILRAAHATTGPKRQHAQLEVTWVLRGLGMVPAPSWMTCGRWCRWVVLPR